MIAGASAPDQDGGDRIDVWQLEARREWMQIVPTEGLIQAEGSQEFTLTFDGTDLPAEQFEGELFFTHDGIGGETIIPLTLNVMGGPQDNPPAEFNLVSPENDAMILAPEAIVFQWEPSIDPDEGDLVTYEVWFLAGEDSTGIAITDTSLTVPLEDLADSLNFELIAEVPITWWVVAESGIFGVESNDRFSLTLLPDAVDMDNPAIPFEFSIQAAYPNPFNSRTIVRYGLARNSSPQFRLYDMSGRLVRDRSLGYLMAGYHTVTIDGADLSAGVYLLELVAEGKSLRRKLALVK